MNISTRKSVFESFEEKDVEQYLLSVNERGRYLKSIRNKKVLCDKHGNVVNAMDLPVQKR